MTANFAYDDLGRRTALTRGNGTSTAYGYDGASRLTSLSHDLAGTSADIAWTLAYNPASQIVSRTVSNAAYNGPAPANGTTGYSGNGLNQYIAVGSASPTYDSRGNITYDGARTYTYDPLNRLLTASGAGSMNWDPVSRLAGVVAGGTTVNLNYDGDDLIDEYLTSGMLRRHIFGPDMDEPLLTYEGSDTSNPSWLYADALGSVVGYANSSGASTTATGFDEYGLNNNTGGRFQFTGQAWFPGATGSDIYHYKARAYSATLGRFLQPDPILYAGGMNLYAYVGNDPVNLVDPMGLWQAPQPDSRRPPCDDRPDCIVVRPPFLIGNAAAIRTGSAPLHNSYCWAADWACLVPEASVPESHTVFVDLPEPQTPPDTPKQQQCRALQAELNNLTLELQGLGSTLGAIEAGQRTDQVMSTLGGINTAGSMLGAASRAAAVEMGAKELGGDAAMAASFGGMLNGAHQMFSGPASSVVARFNAVRSAMRKAGC